MEIPGFVDLQVNGYKGIDFSNPDLTKEEFIFACRELVKQGTANVIVVSDASPIAGLPPGTYHTLGNNVILEASGRLYNPKTGYLVGSSSTMRDCMNFLLSLGMLNLRELFDVGFYNPLRLINIDSSVILDNASPLVKLKNDQF